MVTIRTRRNRKTEAIRRLTQETTVVLSDLVLPCFVMEKEKQQQPICSLPGHHVMTRDYLLKKAEHYHRQGVMALALFPVIDPSLKDPQGSHALSSSNELIQTIQLLKQELPSLCLIADIALDPFTSHGHDGVIDSKGYVLNDLTVDRLCEMALLYADAGVDVIAPSDMMDGRIQAIRTALDEAHFTDTSILAYSAKYSSSLYAPFRETVGSKVTIGDKKNYQLNPANFKEALRQVRLDIEQGADMVMVKPAISYLDIIYRLQQEVTVPLCGYHVSGEYAVVVHAAKQGLIDAPAVFYEQLQCIKRAGADFIFTYAIDQVLPFLKSV
ncbi:MAG: porphobilinogen synthase [Candidatus Rhabdochlamydia sp.]